MIAVLRATPPPAGFGGALLRTAATLVFLLLAAWPAPARAVELHAGRVSPAPSGQIPLGGSLFVEVHYVTPGPTRFQARASFRGKPVEGRLRINHAFPDPAGTGTSLVWVAFHEPARIDALEIVAFDVDWREIAAATLPVALT